MHRTAADALRFGVGPILRRSVNERQAKFLVRDQYDNWPPRKRVTELLPARKLLEISALRGTGNGESEERRHNEITDHRLSEKSGLITDSGERADLDAALELLSA